MWARLIFLVRWSVQIIETDMSRYLKVGKDSDDSYHLEVLCTNLDRIDGGRVARSLPRNRSEGLQGQDSKSSNDRPP